ncbi:2-hydroxychromene-2-carboxylate isomerase [Pseudomonadota bacterium]
MTETIDYYFCVVSPWTYFGDERFQDLCRRNGLAIRFHPLLSPVLFPSTGGALLKDRAKPRRDYRMAELKRWRDHLGININLEPKHFPVPEAPASQLILCAQDSGADVGPLVHAILRAVWQEERNVSDPATLAEIATACGLDGDDLTQQSQTDAFEQAFQATTQAAVERGVFGYPTYMFRDDMFWGQDRLDFLERSVEAALT